MADLSVIREIWDCIGDLKMQIIDEFVESHGSQAGRRQGHEILCGRIGILGEANAH